jgi:hypothetical protein
MSWECEVCHGNGHDIDHRMCTLIEELREIKDTLIYINRNLEKLCDTHR